MPKKKSKNSITQLLIYAALAFLIGGIFFWWKAFSLNLASSAEGQLTLNYGDHQRVFVGPVEDNTTIWMALYSSAQGNNLPFHYQVLTNGDVAIEQIDKQPSSGSQRWVFYLNGQPVATKDLNRLFLKKGDRVEGRLE